MKIHEKQCLSMGATKNIWKYIKNKETEETHRRSMEIKGDLRKSMNVNEQTGAPVLQICSISIQVGAPASQICKRPTSQIRNRYKQTGAPVSKTKQQMGVPVLRPAIYKQIGAPASHDVQYLHAHASLSVANMKYLGSPNGPHMQDPEQTGAPTSQIRNTHQQ